MIICLTRMNGFRSDTVGGYDRHNIGSGMSLHTAFPMRHTVKIQYRFRTDCCRIEKKLCPHQRHAACGFGKPLIPADPHTDPAEFCFPDLKSSISGSKIEFFLIEMIIRNMGFSVYSEDGSVCIYDGSGIIDAVDIFFIKADRQNDTKLLCHRPETLDCRIVVQLRCKLVVVIISFLTKIKIFKQFGKQNYICTLRSCFADKRFCLTNIFVYAACHGHLHSGDLYISH